MNNLHQRLEKYLPFFWQVFRFGVVGVTAAGINFSVVVFLVQHYDLHPLVANVFGFLTAFQLSYWGHRVWTFGATDISHRSAVTKLVIVQVLGFGANETLFYIFLSLHLPYMVALLLVLSILPVFTFFSSRYWVFR
ncbi:MAG: GtrA family protein [Gammaproteobacteria bacterium]